MPFVRLLLHSERRKPLSRNLRFGSLFGYLSQEAPLEELECEMKRKKARKEYTVRLLVLWITRPHFY
jgi:hypothetical protein